jgi:hypothetical protein
LYRKSLTENGRERQLGEKVSLISSSRDWRHTLASLPVHDPYSASWSLIRRFVAAELRFRSIATLKGRRTLTGLSCVDETFSIAQEFDLAAHRLRERSLEQS